MAIFSNKNSTKSTAAKPVEPPEGAYESYFEFIHTFVDRTDEVNLHSLKVGGVDLGWRQRFYLPLDCYFSDQTLRCYQLRFFGALEDAFEVGWNIRSIEFNLEKMTYRSSEWQSFKDSDDLDDMDFSVSSKAQAIKNFESPKDQREFESKLVLDAAGGQSTDRFKTTSWKWSEATNVHYEARRSNTSEIPLLSFFVSADDTAEIACSYASLKNTYEDLDKHLKFPENKLDEMIGLIDQETVILWTRVSPLLALENYVVDDDILKQGFVLQDGSQLQWKDLALDTKFKGATKFGGFTFEGASVQEPLVEGWLPRGLSTNFSSLNSYKKTAEMVNFFRNWKFVGSYKVEINEEWWQFLSAEGPAFSFSMSWESQGCLRISLSNQFYRALMLEKRPGWKEFVPDKKMKLWFSARSFDIYDFSAVQVVPTPDSLLIDEKVLILWKKDDVVGISDGIYTFHWKNEQFENFELSESDSFSDRGGPYSHLYVRLKDGSSISFTEQGNTKLTLEALSKFLEK